MRYKGYRIFMKVVDYNFRYNSFKYGNNIVIYFDKNLNRKEKSKLLHSALKKARK